MSAHSVALRPASAAARPASDALTPAAPSRGFAAAFERALRALERGSAEPPRVSELDAERTLALQASTYRQVERVELVSRLVDHGVGAVKTILQTRV
jgi:hypothetical protein